MKIAILSLLAASMVIQAAPALAQSQDISASARQELSFGTDALQALDYWPGADSDAPLVIFVHGGGWKRGDKQMMQGSAKLSHWQELGFAVASLNYRLVPEATVEQQAGDVAAATAFLHTQAETLGFDAERIALIGHSAGAHLVALVGTDPSFLAAQGLSFADIRGIIPLDGAAYDVAEQLDENGLLMRRTYQQAFGSDADRHRALSPMHHAATPNVAEFLILHVQRDDAIRQSGQLAQTLRRSGTNAQLQGFAGSGLRGHRQINRDMGEADYPATAVVDEFLARIFAAPAIQ